MTSAPTPQPLSRLTSRLLITLMLTGCQANPPPPPQPPEFPRYPVNRSGPPVAYEVDR